MRSVVVPGSNGRAVIIHAVDHDAVADSVCDDLEDRGVRCWLASRDVPPGTSDPDARVAAIEDAGAIVAIVTSGCDQDGRFLRALELAYTSRRPIIPLLVDGAVPEGAVRYYVGEDRRVELVAGAPAALDTLAVTVGRFTTDGALPRAPSALIGRRRELVDLVSHLRSPDCRLVTLTGPGGSGKTRLALEAARALSPGFENGGSWVSLAPVREPALASAAITRALSIDDADSSSFLDTLTAALGGNEQLIVLDNVEHLLPEVAADVSTIVARCPGVRLLVTSRERLNIQGERAFAINSLGEADAIALFLERARQAGEDVAESEDVRDLCRRLDHLPLALELAAARTVVLSPNQLLARLSARLDLLRAGRDVDPRQQTLRATIDWSYELLTAEEQLAFRSMSVFVGACTLEAADVVAGATPDVLQSLIEKSLVLSRDTAPGRRYAMLETIREYAVEKASGSDHDASLLRHARHFCALAVDSGDRPDVLDALASDRDDLELALRTASLHEPSLVVRAAPALRRVMRQLALMGTISDVLASVVDDVAEDASGTLVDAIVTLGTAEYMLGKHDVATQHLERAIELARQLDDHLPLARALNNRAVNAYNVGDWRTARPLFVESLGLLRELKHPLYAVSLANLCATSLNAGDFVLARELIEDLRALDVSDDEVAIHAELMASIVESCDGSSEIARERASAALELAREARLEDSSDARWILARSELQLGNTDAARTLLRASHSSLIDGEDMPYLAEFLFACAAFAVRTGDAETSLRLLGAAERVEPLDAAYDQIWRAELVGVASSALEGSEVRHHVEAGSALGHREALELAERILAVEP